MQAEHTFTRGDLVVDRYGEEWIFIFDCWEADSTGDRYIVDFGKEEKCYWFSHGIYPRITPPKVDVPYCNQI